MDEVLGKLLKEGQRWANINAKLLEVSKRLEALRPEVQDLADTCRDLSEEFEADPQRLEEVEQRIGFIKKTPDAVREDGRGTDRVSQDARRQGEGTSAAGRRPAGIDGELKAAWADLKKAAATLSSGGEDREEARGRCPEATRRFADARRSSTPCWRFSRCPTTRWRARYRSTASINWN
ncbi:MAG: hypothetical protein U0792_21695 [Gemmataceae bacterium]